MDAGHELGFHLVVALGTSVRNVELENRTFWICRGQDLVRTMTVCTNGGFLRSCCYRFSVDTLFVRIEGRRRTAARFHYKFLAMTRSTSLRDVLVRHRGRRIACRHYLVQASMT